MCARNNSAAVLTLVLGLAGLSSIARAGTIRHDVQDNRYSRAAFDFPNVGFVAGMATNVNGMSIVWYGSAVLIDPSHVLTAAHIVEWPLAFSAFRDVEHTMSLRVGFGSVFRGAKEAGSPATAAARFREGVEWWAHDDWDWDSWDGADIGLVRLASPVEGIAPASYDSDPPIESAVARMVGYGFQGTGLTGAADFASWDARKRAGENAVVVYDADAFEALGLGRVNERLLMADFDHSDDPSQSTWDPKEPLAMEMQVSSGDSGGPVFIDGQVVAIHNFVIELDNSCPGLCVDFDYGEVSGHTRVAPFRDWIDEIIAGGGENAATAADASNLPPELSGTEGNWAVYSTEPHVFLPGDADHSGSVDDGDLSALLSGWQQPGIWLTGDFSNDGFVDDNDLSLLLANWTGSVPVPEPATLGLLVAVGAGMLHVRRRNGRCPVTRR